MPDDERPIESHLGDAYGDPVPPLRPPRKFQPKRRQWIESGLNAFIGWSLCALFFLFVLAVVYTSIAFIEMRRSFGHEWYPVRCCSGGDCVPLEPTRVHAMNDGGYIVDGKITVRRDDVQQSLDGRYHACFPFGRLSCFFAPARGL